MTQYVQLSADATKVIAWFAGSQPVTEDKPGYAEIEDADPRIAAFQAANAAPALLAQKVAAGVALVSTGTPAISGTYAIDPATQQKVAAISLYIAVNNRFPAGQATLAYPDLAGVTHVFPTTTLFQAFATALADHVAALDLATAGAGIDPVQPVMIA